MAGNTLGVRRYFTYTSDTGETYSILTDQDLGAQAGLPLGDTSPPAPRRFKPRGVYAEATIAGKKVRKFLICNTDSPLYEDNAVNVTVDTTVFRTTGRRGERFSFGANPPA